MNVKGSVTNEDTMLEEGSILSMENRAYYDSAIKASILRTLTWYSRAPLEDICINVKHGYVTLSGMVPFLYQKMVIVSTVRHVKGVKGVHNNITLSNSIPVLVTD